MIIDVLKSKGVPFRCNNCNTYFAWKPDEQGECRICTKYKQCEKTECNYYEPVGKKCPECGSSNLTEIPAIVYKIMRNVRR